MIRKKILSLILALALLLCSIPALAETTGGAPKLYTHDGRVTLVDGAYTDDPIRSPEEAAAVVASMTKLLGGGSGTRFEYLRTLTDAVENQYYVFKQVLANTTVLNGAVKVITDKDGKMIGLSSSVEPNLPDETEAEGITAAEAEKAVEARIQETNQTSQRILPELTSRLILPMVTSVDDEENDIYAAHFVWVVYTENPDGGLKKSADLPYLAHYVNMNGVYLYSLPTLRPGDEASRAGFDASYVFEFMEPAEYTGYVDLSDGTEKELTVTVMRDRRTGMYYLGNLERRIVVADCYEFLYNGGNVKLEYSPDNREWDQTGLLSLYYYCKAWDYYNAIGWKGGDGQETPILILNNFCDEQHGQVDNAAYVGNALGWQIFAASRMNDYSQCLDIIAHEYTHCVTGSMMTYNSYVNDYGAINEAISDIQGNLCEMMMAETENKDWTLGENSKTPVRSMSDPHQYKQPAHKWDLYYKDGVETPTVLNDVGGVHSNSSLLNYVAWSLCEEGGMSLEDARSFWFAVDCAMVPGTDYVQLSELLPWTLKSLNMTAYEEALNKVLAQTRLGQDTVPETLGEDQALITLKLPDSEVFRDGNWTLQIFSVNPEKLTATIKNLLHVAEEKGGKILDKIINSSDDFLETLKDVLKKIFPEGTFYYDSGAAGIDGQTIRMMACPGYTVPILLHLEYDENTQELRNPGAAVLLFGRWYNLTGLIDLGLQLINQKLDLKHLPEIMPASELAILGTQLALTLKFSSGPKAILRNVSSKIRGGKINELPTDGLENVTWVEDPLEMLNNFTLEEVPARMSRPKE